MRRRAADGAAAAIAIATAVVMGAALAGAGCALPPWSMGAPLDGKPSIPETTASPSVRQRKAEARAERAAGHAALELRALLALDEADRLAPDERARLTVLLQERAAELLSMGRAVPAAQDLLSIERLAPERAATLRPLRMRAERDAGDAWLAVGDRLRAREAYQRARALGAGDLDIRFAALDGIEPAPGVPADELKAAIAALPLRVLTPFARAYVTRGGADRQVLERALLAARQERQRTLAARLEDALAMTKPPADDTTTKLAKTGDASAPAGVVPAAAVTAAATDIAPPASSPRRRA